ncbi:putative coiled-coil protein SlyX [Pedobacter sp. AK013]|uniref:hypothetical protein n=1 Tax=Pedobacter sp. AK013 TaxID=2723071 RepID=UPI001619FC39|nr:hypothetical protein [Pedobacter sp. AK013]MBB6239858.1 putative coiled-coil protein SlyX [Pedobacter sp. AK013]
MKIFLLSILLCSAGIVMAQPQVVTTGNNVIDASNPYAADVVIGSDAAGGTRHDSSIMWWSNLSASRISNTGNAFNFSVWAAPQTPNVSLSTEIGGRSYLMGNLGIGTSTPEELLEIRANQPVITFHQPGISSFKMGTSNGVFKLLAMDNGFGGHTGNFSDTNNPYVFSFLQNGNVGIGTSTPREKLSVNGKIRAHEIKVEATNWPDYVFEEGYTVGTLQELESYIKTNKHLPDMPSAKEIDTQGLQLGEMVKMQQRKIEELALHLIEKEKQLRNQENKVIQLESKLTQQEKTIQEILKKIK